eukprot:12205727-Alexandrium_andersonii.AAC.1
MPSRPATAAKSAALLGSSSTRSRSVRVEGAGDVDKDGGNRPAATARVVRESTDARARKIGAFAGNSAHLSDPDGVGSGAAKLPADTLV